MATADVKAKFKQEVDKLKLGSSRLNLQTKLVGVPISISETYTDTAGGRVVSGRFDVSLNNESIGRFFYGQDAKGARGYTSRTLAFDGIKNALKSTTYLIS